MTFWNYDLPNKKSVCKLEGLNKVNNTKSRLISNTKICSLFIFYKQTNYSLLYLLDMNGRGLRLTLCHSCHTIM